jgi:hypothetical protein
MPSKDDSTPFLVACSTGATTCILQRYLDEVDYYIDRNWVDRSARTLVLQPDNQGTTPLIGWISFHRGWIAHLELTSSDKSRERALTGYLELATRMVWFATMHVAPEYPSSNPLVVHRCAFIAPYCPVFMIQWLVHLREDTAEAYVPEHECAATRDEMGRLPLHNAIEAIEISSTPLNFAVNRNDTHAATSPLIGHRKHRNFETNRNEIINTLLRWYPKAAGEPFPNGRSPLCEAIGRGGYWHSAT